MKIIDKFCFEDKTIYLKEYGIEKTIEIQNNNGDTMTISRAKGKIEKSGLDTIFNYLKKINR